MPDIRRRILLSLAAFRKVENTLKINKTCMVIKKKVLNEYALPVMTYGSETWALNNTIMEKLVVTQRKMERFMLGITLQDQKRNSWIRSQRGVTDIIDCIRSSKLRWAGNVARLQDNR